MDDTGHPMNINSDESCEGAGTTYQKENHKNKWKVTGERSECKTEILNDILTTIMEFSNDLLCMNRTQPMDGAPYTMGLQTLLCGR